MNDIPAWRLFWAKTDRRRDKEKKLVNPEWTHPLWAHLLDVACVAEALANYLPRAVKDNLAEQLGLQWEEAKPLLTLLIGLHDVGKAIPSFQTMHEPSRKHLRACGFDIADRYQEKKERRHHGHASIPILHTWLDQVPLADNARPLLKVLAAFSGFHHGRLEKKDAWDQSTALGNEQWRKAQQNLIEAVAEVWMEKHGGWPDLRNAKAPRRGWPFPPVALAFAGWTTLADWIGSMSEHMPKDANSFARLTDYLPVSRQAAQTVLQKVHLHRCAALHVNSTESDFKVRFPAVFETDEEVTPHPLQRLAATLELPPADVPALVLIEAPTGEGKTEAAFYLAARLQARRYNGRGVYVALPTQATSNGLFPRFVDFLEQAHDSNAAGTPPNVLLVHGASALNLDLENLLQPLDEDEATRSSAYAAQWFLPTKRSLLAPYGVGTIDQALLGALTSRHFFLRLFGLAGKTIVFDEVHAYDSYMVALFTRLLEWLRALGSDVIILTATLPQRTRQALLAAWGASNIPDPNAYPALTVAAAPDAEAGHIHAFKGNFETSQKSETKVCFEESAPERIAELVAEATKAGATVGVILNRVDRAQAVFALLLKMEINADLHLLHARFPFAERAKREQDVINRFGKKGRRAAEKPGVLIATQVAEQSLDFDVDLMLSDLAPIDLLLQRAGRLHRHKLPRPKGFERPRLLVLRPPLDTPDALPDVSGIGGQFRPDDPDAIYLNLPLFRTDFLLRNRSGWTLPTDYRPLIEAAYGEDDEIPPQVLSDEDQKLWDAAVKAKQELEKEQIRTANLVRLPEPGKLKVLFANIQAMHRTDYDEGDDTPALDLKPQTRLGGPSVQVVCLHRRDGSLFLNAEGTIRLPEGPKLEAQQVRSILKQTVRLTRKRVVDALKKGSVLPEPEAKQWKQLAENNAPLAFLHPIVFEQGRCAIGETVIELHPDLGIRYNPDAP